MHKLSVLFFTVFLVACQTTHPDSVSAHAANPSRDDLTEYALSLQGTPYKYGGNSPDTGFDCSGFVGYVFKHSAGKSLPRSSAAISHIGAPEKASALKPGDLVFYNTLHKAYSHVGIYLGNRQFIHAPSSGKSVSIVNMDEEYWLKRYNGARRLMP
jgi:cell wall-associated NlpC family hydrolase